MVLFEPYKNHQKPQKKEKKNINPRKPPETLKNHWKSRVLEVMPVERIVTFCWLLSELPLLVLNSMFLWLLALV